MSCYVPNSIDRIKFDFSTAVARRLKPSRATAVWHGKAYRAARRFKRRATAAPNSIYKLKIP